MGKTVVAKIIGKIYAKMGLLSKEILRKLHLLTLKEVISDKVKLRLKKF